MFAVDGVTIFSFSLNFDRWMVTCPLLLGVYKPLTVLGMCVFVHSYSGTISYRPVYEQYQWLYNKNVKGDFSETTLFGRYGVKTT